MQLKNMEMTKEEQKEMDSCMAVNPPKYPYGLNIRLEDGSLDALGLTELPKVGSTMLITARVSVESVSERTEAKGDKEREVSLQITDMALGPDVKPNDQATVMYPKSGAKT